MQGVHYGEPHSASVGRPRRERSGVGTDGCDRQERSVRVAVRAAARGDGGAVQWVRAGSLAPCGGSRAAASSVREPRSSFWKTWVRWVSTVRRVM